MHLRTFLPALFVSLSLAATMAACKPGRNAAPDHGEIKQAHPPEMTSEGIKADYRIAEELNKIPGLQGAAVLIRNGEAYVGAYIIGDEKAPDAYMKKPYGTYYPDGQQPWATQDRRSPNSGKGIPNTNPSGSPETSQNGVTQSGQNVNDLNNPPGSAVPPSHSSAVPDQQNPSQAGSATGNVDPELLGKIESAVKSMAPDVTKIHFTGERESVGRLQGYARYIQDGGSMERLVGDFTRTIKQIFPDAKP